MSVSAPSDCSCLVLVHLILQETSDQAVTIAFDVPCCCILLEPLICLSIVIDRCRVKTELSDLLKNRSRQDRPTTGWCALSTSLNDLQISVWLLILDGALASRNVMPKFGTLTACAQASYPQSSAFHFFRDNPKNAEIRHFGDNGGEFINLHLARYCEDHGITFTRGRPYRKNDTCFVEQKNGHVVRRAVATCATTATRNWLPSTRCIAPSAC